MKPRPHTFIKNFIEILTNAENVNTALMLEDWLWYVMDQSDLSGFLFKVTSEFSKPLCRSLRKPCDGEEVLKGAGEFHVT